MRRIRMVEQSLLLGDRAADLLLAYAALLAQIGRGDSVTLHAVDDAGESVVVGLLLNSGTVLVVERTGSDLAEPDNGEAERYLQRRLEAYAGPAGADGAAAGNG